ncbi:MAG: hypothetical protein ACHQ53_03330 [Polyangiales bacterium]
MLRRGTLCLALALAAAAAAEPAAKLPVIDTRQPLLLAVDDDDDDDDGVVDSEQASHVPSNDLVEIVLQPGQGGDVRLATLGGLRVLRQGALVSTPLTIPEDQLPLPISLQATRPSQSGHPAALLATQGGVTLRLPVHTVQLALLDATDHPLSAARDALGVSHHVTNDRSLPRGNDYAASSPDPANVRVQVQDASAQGMRVSARLQTLGADGGRARNALDLTLQRPEAGLPFRSGFVRLVGDPVDLGARGVAGQVLQVALRDRVQIVYETPLGRVQQTMRVGRPGDETGPRAARQATLRVIVMRAYQGGPPVIGVDDLSAIRIVREELSLANEIWLQCDITFGVPSETSVQLVDPPGPSLLAVADGDGLPARSGSVRFRVDGQVVGPIEIPTGALPEDTALRIAQALRAAGLSAVVTRNPPAVFGAGMSADVLVRRRDGNLAQIEPIEGVPLTTDKQQSISIGSVDLGDGLEEFDNMTAQSGTLEERTLIKALADDDPGHIDLFIVNRFTHGTRQGEAFIAASAGPIINTVLLDRNGLRQRQTAWTMAHELGHVLLNQPLHPDNVGSDLPMLLMDSDNNRGTVNGPKRLLVNDCLRARYESSSRADPPLLRPYDARILPSKASSVPAVGAKQ